MHVIRYDHHRWPPDEVNFLLSKCHWAGSLGIGIRPCFLNESRTLSKLAVFFLALLFGVTGFRIRTSEEGLSSKKSYESLVLRGDWTGVAGWTGVDCSVNEIQFY